MGKAAETLANFQTALKKDVNLNRAGRGIRRGAKAFPRATGRYIVDRIPIVRWLPKYSPQWIINDAIAGTTIGMMLIPQAIIFSGLAGVSPQDGLTSAWLPPILYTIMGTSKDVSTGPTATTALLTASALIQLEAFKFSPLVLLPSLTLSVGFFSLFFGIFNLGWILDFMSLPIVLGFVLADGIITMQSQLPLLLGLSKIRNAFLDQSIDMFNNIKNVQPLSIAIGVGTIILLVVLQLIGTKFGKRHVAIEVFASFRYALAIIAFTTLTWLVNQNKPKPLWGVTGTIPEGLLPPKSPQPLAFILVVGIKGISVFFAAAIEHLAVAKAFGRQHGYEINPSTELTYLGITNIANGLFGGLPVSGSLSRTAINSGANVKSPLSGFFTTGTVLAAIFILRNAFFWIPLPTVAAVTIVATLMALPPISITVAQWRGSFMDFLSSQIATQLGLLSSLNMSVGTAVSTMTMYTLIRARWSGAEFVDRRNLDIKFGNQELKRGIVVQGGMCVVNFKDNVFFLNAARVRKVLLKGLGTYYERVLGWQKNRLWCEKKEAVKEDDQYTLSRNTALRVLILDFSAVSFIDTTTMTMLADLTNDLKAFADEGSEVEIRFVGLSKEVRERFDRCRWKLMNGGAPGGGDGLEGDRCFEDLRSSIEFPIIGKGNFGNPGMAEEREGEYEMGSYAKDDVEVQVRYIGF